MSYIIDDVTVGDFGNYWLILYCSLVAVVPLMYIEIWRKSCKEISKIDTFVLILNIIYLIILSYAIRYISTVPEWLLRENYFLLQKIALLIPIANILLRKSYGLLGKIQEKIYLLISIFLIGWYGSMAAGLQGRIPDGIEGVIMWSVFVLSLLNFLLIFKRKNINKD